MKTKKMFLAAIACALVSAMPTFATSDLSQSSLNSTEYTWVTDPYERISTHSLAMGGATLADSEFFDSWLDNPAMISKTGFRLVFPSVTVAVNNPSKLLVDGNQNNEPDIVEAAEGSSPLPDISTILLSAIDGRNADIVTTQAMVGLKFRHLATALEVQQNIAYYSTGNGETGYDGTNPDVLSETNAVATAGLGFSMLNGFIDVGASGSFVYRVYSSGVTYDNLYNMIDDDTYSNTLLYQTPFASGYAIPVSVGANVNLPMGLTVSAVMKNINGTYTFTAYDSLKTLLDEDPILSKYTEDLIPDDAGYTGKDPSASYTVTSDSSLSLGAAWKLDSLPFRPVITADLDDCLDYFEAETEEEKQDALMSSLHLGAKANLLGFIDLRAGWSENTRSFGVGLDLLLFHIDAAYYTVEYGDRVGDHPVEGVSVRFSLLNR
ncbi:MAG: hypothetical protein LKE40_04715 [Spirochaetia bacterium]|jgi:hypothetical protein|nr:hypothetical protein [Spirochaetia bacterium]